MNEIETLKNGTIVDLNDRGFYTFEIASGESYTLRDAKRLTVHMMDFKATVNVETGAIVSLNSFHKCPYCGSANVECNGVAGGDKVIDEGDAAECRDCEAIWSSEF